MEKKKKKKKKKKISTVSLNKRGISRHCRSFKLIQGFRIGEFWNLKFKKCRVCMEGGNLDTTYLGNDDPTIISHDTGCWLKPNWGWAACFNAPHQSPSSHLRESFPDTVQQTLVKKQGQGAIIPSSKAKVLNEENSIPTIPEGNSTRFDAAKQLTLFTSMHEMFRPHDRTCGTSGNTRRTPFGSRERTFYCFKYEYFPGSFPLYSPITLLSDHLTFSPLAYRILSFNLKSNIWSIWFSSFSAWTWRPPFWVSRSRFGRWYTNIVSATMECSPPTPPGSTETKELKDFQMARWECFYLISAPTQLSICNQRKNPQ